MRQWMAFLALLPACGGGDQNGDDAPPPPKQYGSFIQVKLAASDVLNTEQAWTGMVDIDTDLSAAATSGCKAPSDGATYCVVAYSKITLASTATLTAHGSRPLVLLATSSFDLEGTIDVSSGSGRSGAGANPMGMCQGTMATGHSGGYGGSFGGKGGDGGKPLSGAGEAGGVAAAPLGSIPKILRGGCPGGAGATDGGPGGAGGGAVLIISPTIMVNGKINASGAGGHGGTSSAAASGGGGGGSGGMIVLDGMITAASTPAFEIWLFANGGGGGQGGTATGPGTGAGADGGESLAPMIAAPAGNDGNRSGGAGGIGSFGTNRADGAPAGNAFNSGGGGAGGGGTGFIHLPPNAPAIAGAMFAPSPSST